MKADEIIIGAITHGNCPFQYYHIPKTEWNCNKFDNCTQCAEELLKLHDTQKKAEENKK